MRHVEGILDEVRRSYTSLKAQAEKAEAYRTLREEIFEVELEIQLLRLKGLLEDKKKREGRLEEKAKSRDEIVAGRSARVNEAIAQQVDMVNSMESQLVESHKKLYQLDMEKNTRESQDPHVPRAHHRAGAQHRGGRGCGRRTSAASSRRWTRRRQRQTASRAELVHAHRRRRRSNIEGFIRGHRGVRGARAGERRGDPRATARRSRSWRRPSRTCASQLRAITEDIVTQLDARLKEMGYSSAERGPWSSPSRRPCRACGSSSSGKETLLEDAAQVENTARARSGRRSSQNTLGRAEGRPWRSWRPWRSSSSATAPSPRRSWTSSSRPRASSRASATSTSGSTRAPAGIARLRQRNEELAQENAGLREKIDEYRKTLEDLRVNLARLQTQTDGHGAGDRSGSAASAREQETLLTEVGRGDRGDARPGRRRPRRGSRRRRRSAQEIEEQEKTARSALSGLEGEISSRNKELVSKEEELKQKNALLARAQSEIEKMQIEVTEIRTEIKDLHASFTERFSRDLSEYETRIPDLQPNRDLRPRLAELREEMRKLGQVNLMAPEEFAEVKDRFDFLTGQLADLTRAREDLKKVTTEIRTESTELFLDTYNKIKKNFHTVFRRLFGGGRAELHLENPDAPLESGIEVFAQPPGKKLENINLLSGGERSLTGVSLMFAIYMVKPSPFCLLDEIDAALDEENVGRLTNLLKEFSTNSQFIVITHNKRTVAGADVLYGVTMEESGVSKLVAIRLENKERGETVPSTAPV